MQETTRIYENISMLQKPQSYKNFT